VPIQSAPQIPIFCPTEKLKSLCENRAGWIGPTGMFGIFLVSTAINKLLMRPVVQMTVQKEKREGNLRFKQMQVSAQSYYSTKIESPKEFLGNLFSSLSDLAFNFKTNTDLDPDRSFAITLNFYMEARC
jgi:hypothetical protein